MGYYGGEIVSVSLSSPWFYQGILPAFRLRNVTEREEFFPKERKECTSSKRK